MQIQILLTQGKFAIIDKRDFLLVNKYKWLYRKSGRTNGRNGYAQTKIKKKSLFMHNLIMKPPKGMVVDHIDRNSLKECAILNKI